MTEYRYAIDLLAEDGRPLGRVAVRPDWRAALGWVHFEGIREGTLRPVTSMGPGTVEPIWDGRAGKPYVGAFRAAVGDRGVEVVREIPRRYLRGFAAEAFAGLVEQGVLQPGTPVRYVVVAFPTTERATAHQPDGSGFSVEEVERPLPLTDAPLAAFFGRSVVAEPPEIAGFMPVFVPQRVLDEAVALSRKAADVETGGVLVGTLHRDSGAGAASAPALFVEITAQIPAPYTLSASTKLTFTADTWQAVQAALELRRRDEMMLAWWHFHPDFCRLGECPPERRQRCTGARPFFSAEDVHLHATCFPAAYHTALLISDGLSTGGMTPSLFGWWQGMVVRRGFHVLDGTAPAGAPAGG